MLSQRFSEVDARVEIIELHSTIISPYCSHQETETMLPDKCQYCYERKSCEALLKPKRDNYLQSSMFKPV